MKPPVICLFVQHTCPEYPLVTLNTDVCISATFSNMDVVYKLTDSTYVLGETLAITALQTKVTRGRLSLIRIKDHKEQICRLIRCAWLAWVFSMVQCVPTAGRCPKILFCIVAKSLACFCRGCCVRRLTMLAISAFIRPCPKLQCAWDSFWQFPVATRCTACTQDHWSCNPHRAAQQKAIKGSMRNMQGTMRICWLFALPSTQKPCSNLSACCEPFSSKTLLGKESSDQRQEKSLASSFAVDLHELSRRPQHYENDSTAWSFQTLTFAMIWSFWNQRRGWGCLLQKELWPSCTSICGPLGRRMPSIAERSKTVDQMTSATSKKESTCTCSERLRKHPHHWGCLTSNSCVNPFSCPRSLRQLPHRKKTWPSGQHLSGTNPIRQDKTKLFFFHAIGLCETRRRGGSK